MELSRQRAFTSPRPGEDWQALAARCLPDLEPDQAVERLQSWNLHLFTRRPSGKILGSDVIFVEPPLAQGEHDSGHDGG